MAPIARTGSWSLFHVLPGFSKPQSMYLLYSFVLSLLFLALLPYFVFQAVRHGKYAGSLTQRMGRLPESLRGDGRVTIWVHAVSVGEFMAARPLIKRLRNELSDARIVVSTTTLTGQGLARSETGLFDAAFYFPFDWTFAVRRAIAHVKPTVVIILETELWPNFLRECRKQGVKTVLANGRISERSFRRYKLVARPLRRAIEDVSLMIMQSEEDADRARLLGAPSSRLRVCGNLKYDVLPDGSQGLGDEGRGFGVSVGTQRASNPRPPVAIPDPNPQSPTPNPHPDIDLQFALSLSPHLIVAGSTALGEEKLLLAALHKVRKHSGLEDSRLLLAPRHPERFDEVARLIERSGFTFARRTQTRGRSASDPSVRDSAPDNALLQEAVGGAAANVILLDTIGELASVYRFAAVVFVGGSLVPRGGHNVIEPAAFAKPIITGLHTENFRQIVLDFARADAVVQIGAGGLASELVRLLSDDREARAMGERARDILIRNQGATDCTMAMIREVMKSSESGVRSQESVVRGP